MNKLASLALVVILALTIVPTAHASFSADKIYSRVNTERSNAGLPTLSRSTTLDKVAKAKLGDMKKNSYFAHVSPTGVSWADFFTQQNYALSYRGENLAKDFKDEASTVKAWMASQSHKDNILKAKYTETGVAVSGSIVVQVFGGK